jgi:hypothetical protein
VRLRRVRFSDLVRRQLDLFADDEVELLREADDTERTYDAADRDEAEELYGDYQLVLEAIADRLGEIRDAYAATLPNDAIDAYEESFTRAARKRYPKLPSNF